MGQLRSRSNGSSTRLSRTVPVLLCTASKVSVQEMRKADGFLAKPYQESLLYEMVDRLLAKARAEQPR